jgi:hypothetical protein
VGRVIPVRRVRFPSTSANDFAGRGRLSTRHTRLGVMKKLILLVILVALGVVAARKVRSA